jgi:hypothetical protein
MPTGAAPNADVAINGDPHRMLLSLMARNGVRLKPDLREIFDAVH